MLERYGEIRFGLCRVRQGGGVGRKVHHLLVTLMYELRRRHMGSRLAMIRKGRQDSLIRMTLQSGRSSLSRTVRCTCANHRKGSNDGSGRNKVKDRREVATDAVLICKVSSTVKWNPSSLVFSVYSDRLNTEWRERMRKLYAHPPWIFS